MRSRNARVTALFAWIATSAVAISNLAQETQQREAPSPGAPAPAPAAKDKQGGEKLAFFRERLATLRLTPSADPEQKLKLVNDSLVTFENPISQMWDGLMFVWTDHGRPAAAVKSYYHSLNKRWGRTFVSLATERIEMLQQGQKLWNPAEAGLSFSPLPDAPKPAGDARRRLTQMRDIARRFTMVDHWGLKEPTDWQLRLLTTPLHRYEAPEYDVVDGALFGYVVNSPEALVLVEARTTADGLAWHYAVARFTRFEVTVSLDGKQVAHFPRLEAWPNSGVYFHDPVEMADYPFERPSQADSPR